MSVRLASRCRQLCWRLASAAALSLLALVPVHHAAAQNAEEQLPARLGSAARAAIARLVDSARTSGLPVEPLVAKAQEGVLKGADDSRIVNAVATIARNLAEARAAFGPETPPGTLIAGAGALHAGLTARQLRAIRDETKKAPTGRSVGPNAPGPTKATDRGSTLNTPGQLAASEASLSQALIVAGDLVSRGVESSEATTSLIALIARQATDADLEMMRRLVEHDIETGILPRQAVAAQSRAITQRLEKQRSAPRQPFP